MTWIKCHRLVPLCPLRISLASHKLKQNTHHYWISDVLSSFQSNQCSEMFNGAFGAVCNKFLSSSLSVSWQSSPLPRISPYSHVSKWLRQPNLINHLCRLLQSSLLKTKCENVHQISLNETIISYSFYLNRQPSQMKILPGKLGWHLKIQKVSYFRNAGLLNQDGRKTSILW